MTPLLSLLVSCCPCSILPLLFLLEVAYELLIRPFDKVLEHPSARRMSKLPECFNFNLPDALAGDLEVFAHFFQRSFTALGVQSKPESYDLFFPGTQSLEDVARNVA